MLKPRRTNVTSKPGFSVGICILAGGLSSRMGKDKARLRLGRLTLLGHVRARAKELDLPIRVIRRDLVPRRGPVGGIYTALKTSRHDAELFLSCDMPFIPVSLLKQILASYPKSGRPVFAVADGTFGFPLLIPTGAMPTIESHIRTADASIQNLARALKAQPIRINAHDRESLFNINTPADFKRALTSARTSRRPNESRFARQKPSSGCDS